MRETLAQANTRTQAARAANRDCPLSHPPSPGAHRNHAVLLPPPSQHDAPRRWGRHHGVFGLLWQAADGQETARRVKSARCVLDKCRQL